MSPEETHTILKKIQESDFRGLTELNLSCPNVPGKPQIAYDLKQQTVSCQKSLSILQNLLGIKIPPYFRYSSTLTRLQLFLTNIRSNLSIVSTLLEMVFIFKMSRS